MGVCDLLAENRHGMIAAHIVFAVVHAPQWIDTDGEFSAVAIAEMGLARNLWRVGDGLFGTLGHFAHGLAANDPSIGLKALVNPFIVSAQDSGRDARSGRCKTAGMKAAVDGRAHVADDEGSHKQTLALPRQGLSLYGIPDGAPIED